MTLASSWASDSAQQLTGAEIPPSLPSSPPCRVCYCHHLITQVTGTGQWQPCRPAAVDNQLPFPNHFLTAHWQTKPPLPANKVNGSRCLLIHTAGMCQSNQEFQRTPLDISTPNWFWGCSPLPQRRECLEHCYVLQFSLKSTRV